MEPRSAGATAAGAELQPLSALQASSSRVFVGGAITVRLGAGQLGQRLARRVGRQASFGSAEQRRCILFRNVLGPRRALLAGKNRPARLPDPRQMRSVRSPPRERFRCSGLRDVGSSSGTGSGSASSPGVFASFVSRPSDRAKSRISGRLVAITSICEVCRLIGIDLRNLGLRLGRTAAPADSTAARSGSRMLRHRWSGSQASRIPARAWSVMKCSR